MQEIGGYFELEKLISNKYYKDMVELNSGRNALSYLMKAKNIKKIYLPYYLCDSVSKKITDEGYDVEFYNVDKMFKPIFDKKLEIEEYLYIVNYYGQLNNDYIESLKERHNRIIVDNTHAFYQKPIEEIDTIYSCRKFFGVPDGAYLWTNSRINNKLEQDKSRTRISHLVGRLEESASDFYDDFQKSDEEFEFEEIKEMSKFTKNILGAIDYDAVKQKRNSNFKYLYDELRDINKLEIKEIDGPFSYPLLLDNGEKIRRKMIENKIFIAMLWPNVPIDVNKDSIEYNYSKNILPIPCDQRYTVEDMRYIIEKIKCLIKE